VRSICESLRENSSHRWRLAGPRWRTLFYWTDKGKIYDKLLERASDQLYDELQALRGRRG